MKGIFYYLAAFLFLSACSPKSKEDTAVKPEEPKGAVFPKGMPAGTTITAALGPQGGVLRSLDGKFKLTVPAGALTTTTPISVQPVTNTLPGSPGLAYRFTPDNLQFAKPVTMTFTWNDDDMETTAPEALYLAFQQGDGIWRFLPKTTVNAAEKTLTVETTHFSDWAPYAMFYLTREKPEVRTNESIGLRVQTTKNYLAFNFNRTEVEIAQEAVLDDPKNIQNWKLTGAGQLNAEARIARYTAPGTIPQQNPVWVSVDVLHFIPAGKIPGRGNTGKVILRSPIRIVEDTWHYGTIGGVEFTTHQHWFLFQDGILNIEGLIPNGHSVNIDILTLALATGTHTWNNEPLPGSAKFVYLAGLTGAIMHGYTDCTTGYDVNAGGSVTISKLETVNGVKYVEGHYDIGAFDIMAHPCAPPVKHITGEFRVKSR